MFEGMNGIDLRAVFDALAVTPHGNNPKVKVVPWVCTPLIDLAGRSEEQAKQIVKAWFDSGVLIDGPPAKSRNGSDVKTLVPVTAESLNPRGRCPKREQRMGHITVCKTVRELCPSYFSS